MRSWGSHRAFFWKVHPLHPTPVPAMFRPTSPQLSLMEARFLVSPEKRKRLERSWAESFRTHILPLIDEESFRACFAEDLGRPNKSIRLLVGLHLLKEADDLTDEQILDGLEFNIQWQHALGVEPADAHLCEKSLHNFRHKLCENERAQDVFQQVTDALVKVDGLSAGRQRLDSSHVISNIRLLTRLGLFTETVTVFMRDLRREAPEKLAKLETGYRERYLDRDGYFADATREQAQRRLPVVARDLYALVRAFEADEVVKEWACYGLLVRLLSEQCEVLPARDAEPPTVKVKEPKDIRGTSLQSPHDPDATYGHKGKGYEVHLAETCVADNPYQVVTAVDITGAHASDQHATVPMVERLAERGLAPEEMLADTNYSSGENIVECAKRGVKLIAPVHDPEAPPRTNHWEKPVESSGSVPPTAEADETSVATAADAPTTESSAAPAGPDATSLSEPPGAEANGEPALGLSAFTYNSTFNEVTRCPQGETPVAQGATRNSAFTATFSSQTCAGCPLAAQCPSRQRANGDRVLRWRPGAAATSTRQREQQEPAFKEQYKLRSGIESTNAELKGRHGAAELRVRREGRVRVTTLMKVLALNTKRAVQYHTEELRKRQDQAEEVPLPP